MDVDAFSAPRISTFNPPPTRIYHSAFTETNLFGDARAHLRASPGTAHSPTRSLTQCLAERISHHRSQAGTRVNFVTQFFPGTCRWTVAGWRSPPFARPGTYHVLSLQQRCAQGQKAWVSTHARAHTHTDRQAGRQVGKHKHVPSTRRQSLALHKRPQSRHGKLPIHTPTAHIRPGTHAYV